MQEGRFQKTWTTDQMSERLSSFNVSALQPESLAVLLDFDGTLVPIADRPSDVTLTGKTTGILVALSSILEGAVAIVSGRPIHEIDRMFAPWTFPVAGSHGHERRNGRGYHRPGQFDAATLSAIVMELQAEFDRQDGVIIEEKPGSVALHYRQRPELENTCREKASSIAAAHSGAHLLTGKMVVEIKINGQTKADAVSEFMAEEPFAGRIPLYAGDDVTDEDAFRAVAALHGTSIKIGCGPTLADYRTPDTNAFLDWLEALHAHLRAMRQSDEEGASSS